MTKPRPLAERFWEKVEKTETCWLWTAAKNSTGYGQIWIPEEQATRVAHRISLLLAGRPAPDDLDVDHFCRVRHCVNPDHLEPVTRSENMSRVLVWGVVEHQQAKTHCPQLHEYTPENTALVPNPSGGVSRRCRACSAETNARWRARQAVRGN